MASTKEAGSRGGFNGDRDRRGPRRRDSGSGDTAGGLAAGILGAERPANVDAERAVLGSILLKPDVCDDVALVLRPEDFHDEAHQVLFRHLLDLHDSGKRIDSTIVLERLRTKGDLERIGGAPALAEILQSVPHAAHATHYAQIVRDKSMLRALIDASTDILRDAYDSVDEPRELLSRAESKIFEILEHRSSAEAKPINEVLEDVMVRMDARMKHEHTLGGVETGFTDLDSLCGGLHNSELIILAARPSMGKTAFAMNIAEHVAIVVKQPVLFVSLEMACLELADRLLCSSAQVNGHRLRNGTISQEDRRRLGTAEVSFAWIFRDWVVRERQPQPSENSNARRASADPFASSVRRPLPSEAYPEPVDRRVNAAGHSGGRRCGRCRGERRVRGHRSRRVRDAPRRSRPWRRCRCRVTAAG